MYLLGLAPSSYFSELYVFMWSSYANKRFFGKPKHPFFSFSLPKFDLFGFLLNLSWEFGAFTWNKFYSCEMFKRGSVGKTVFQKNSFPSFFVQIFCFWCFSYMSFHWRQWCFNIVCSNKRIEGWVCAYQE
jgi:hypothetical protein